MSWFSGLKKHLPTATGNFVPGMVDVLAGYDPEFPIVRLFYPTEVKHSEKEHSKKWRDWLADDSYLVGFSRVLMLYPFILKLMFWWSGRVYIPAVYGEKPKTDEKLKCIIVSHGLGGCRFLYTNICCELASRGFLVASVEHKDNSACNTYYYKNEEDAANDIKTTLIFRFVKLGNNHYKERNEQIRKRASECIRTIDLLVELNKGKVPINAFDKTPTHKNVDFKLEQLVDSLDTDNFSIMGHSFGAATALYTLSLRPDIKQGILLDPWMFPIKDEELEKKIRQPLLFINTQTFHIATNVSAMSKLLTGDDKKMYTILHTTHENQTDTVLILGYWLNWFMKKLDPIVALKINNDLIFTFLNKHMNFPKEVDAAKEYLDSQRHNFVEGLTKPWA